MHKIILIIIIFLTSCSSAWHMAKAVKKGFTPKKETQIVQVTSIKKIYDTINNTLISIDTIHKTTTNTIYQDRPLTRIEYKTIRDTIRIQAKSNVKQNRDRVRSEQKMSKNKPRSLSWLNWLLIGAVIILLLVKRSNQ